MARSALCPVHFLFFVLRAGGHNGVQLGILREAVNKRDGGIPEEQQPFAGIGMGHIGIMRVRQGVGEPNRIYVLIPGKEDAALA